jgi:hypothetical protein
VISAISTFHSSPSVSPLQFQPVTAGCPCVKQQGPTQTRHSALTRGYFTSQSSSIAEVFKVAPLKKEETLQKSSNHTVARDIMLQTIYDDDQQPVVLTKFLHDSGLNSDSISEKTHGLLLLKSDNDPSQSRVVLPPSAST